MKSVKCFLNEIRRVGISTGEEHIADVIKSTGRNPKAGQLLRILSIPAVPEGREFWRQMEIMHATKRM